MLTERRSNNALAVTLSKSELAYFLNTLNEVLRGIRIENFEGRLGEPMHSAEQLWQKLSGTYDAWDLDGWMSLIVTSSLRA